MCSAEPLREFIRERLTAAAQDIFSEVQKTISRYEEELRLMENCWKPQIKLSRVEQPDQHVGNNKEVLAGPNIEDQQGPEPLQFKQELEPLEMRRDQEEPDPVREDLQKAHVLMEDEASAVPQLFKEGRRSSRDPEETEPKWTEENQMKAGPPLIKEEGKDPELQPPEESKAPETKWMKEENIPIALLIDKEHTEPDSSGLKHEHQEPEHLPSRQNQKDLCRTRVGEQVIQKQFSALMKTSTLEEGDFTERQSRKRADQLSCRLSPVVESNYQEDSPFTQLKKHSYRERQKQSYICDMCGKGFDANRKLQQHFRTHTGERPFSCETCGKSFFQLGNLSLHKRTHTAEKAFFCETCGKGFTLHGTLKVHKRIHTGEKPFSCEMCGKSFTQHSNLNNHKRVHTGEKPSFCETCGKSFTQQGSLIIHNRVHTGEKPYSCEICGKCFRCTSDLKSHKKVHTGEKPYVCETCGKSFTQRGSLILHKRVHTEEKPYSCEICGKCFYRTFDLNRHKKVHTGWKPFVSQTCQKGIF